MNHKTNTSPMVSCSQVQPESVRSQGTVEFTLWGYINLVCRQGSIKWFCKYYAAHGQLNMNSMIKKRNLSLRLYIFTTPVIFLQSCLNSFGILNMYGLKIFRSVFAIEVENQQLLCSISLIFIRPLLIILIGTYTGLDLSLSRINLLQTFGGKEHSISQAIPDLS